MENIWDNIQDQTKVKEILNKITETRRVPHAFIFSGNRGVGKFFTALQFSKYLYSTYYPDIAEYSIQKITNLQEPYVKLVMPLPRGKGETADDGAIDKLTKDQIEEIQLSINNKVSNPFHNFEIEDANTIKISSIRDIKKFLNLNYESAPLRFIIINQAELMNEQSQNALLKSLEEPPEGFFFILLTSEIDKLLPTIQSRSWIVNFEPLSEKTVASILQEYFKIEENIALNLSHFADGSVFNALQLFEYNLDELLETTISILRFALAKRFFSAYDSLQKKLENKDHSELQIIIRMIKIWVNDVLKDKSGWDSFYYQKYAETLKKFNERFINANIENFYSKMDLLEDYCNQNLNLNVITLNIIFEITSLSLRK